jgi:hypothetical protein
MNITELYCYLHSNSCFACHEPFISARSACIKTAVAKEIHRLRITGSFWTLSIVPNSKYKKTQRFENWFYFQVQVRGRGKAATLLGPLERPNLSHWTQQSRCLPTLIRGRKQIQFSKHCVFLDLEFRTMDKVQKPTIARTL